MCQPISPRNRKTGLLVSVKNGTEAREAARCGIAILDVKAPSEGPLGRPSKHVISEIADIQFDKSMSRSIALGELTDFATLDDALPQMLRKRNSFRFYKFGMSQLIDNKNWPELWKVQIERLRGLQPVAVAYADFQSCAAPNPADIIRVGGDLGCPFFLLDTFSKTKNKNIFSHTQESTIVKWIKQAGQAGMKTVIAGSIKINDLNQCIAMHPDYIGVRGAVCSQGRNSQLNRQKLIELLERLQSFA